MKIQDTPTSALNLAAWFVSVPTKVLASTGNLIDYPHFKDRIHDLPDQRDKASIYSRLWSQLCTFQSRQKST